MEMLIAIGSIALIVVWATWLSVRKDKRANRDHQERMAALMPTPRYGADPPRTSVKYPKRTAAGSTPLPRPRSYSGDSDVGDFSHAATDYAMALPIESTHHHFQASVAEAPDTCGPSHDVSVSCDAGDHSGGHSGD